MDGTDPSDARGERGHAGDLPGAPDEAFGEVIPGVTAPGARSGPPRIHDVDSAEARALAAEREETRRLVEAGARTPEELRALAERLQAQRAREELLWREAVRPQLKRARSSSDQTRRLLAAGGALLACVALALVAAATGNAGFVLLPVVVVVVVAYVTGKRARATGSASS